MGNTVWVLKEGQNEDDWDHSFILREEKALDRLAKKIESQEIERLLSLFRFE
jgi:hypothetical protein